MIIPAEINGLPVTSIGNDAFSNFGYGNPKLISVTIPDSVVSIGSSAFSGCNGLINVISLNTTPPEINENTFDNETYNNAKLNIPIGCKTIYWLHPYWEKKKKMEEIDASNIKYTISEKVDEKNNKYYNLQGQRVLNPKNGIYIVNGKKVFIK